MAEPPADPPAPAAIPDQEPDFNAAIDARLQAILPALVAAVQGRLAPPAAAPANAPSPKVSPPKPPRFSGKLGDAEGWVFSVEAYFKATSLDDPHRVTYAATLLTDRAALWWRSISEDPDAPSTWAAFKAELLHNFKHFDSTKSARKRLRFLTQRTSVEAYTADFTNACLEIPGMTEDEKMDRYFAGLKPHLQREIILREPATYKDLVTMAHRLDYLTYNSTRTTAPPGFNRQPGFTANRPTPMELGHVSAANDGAGPSRPPHGPHPRQTPEERERLRRENKCFYCKQPGHIADRCPNKRGNEKRAGKAPVR